MKPSIAALTTCLVLSSALVVPDVYAQFGGGGGGGGRGGRGGSGEHSKNAGCESGEKPAADKGMVGRQAPMSREQLEYHLGTLKVDLRLTSEQSTAWQTFSDQIQALQADMERQHNRSASAVALNTSTTGGIKPIANAVDVTRNRLTALENIEAAGAALYQTLHADQKTIADLRMAAFMTPLLKS